MADDSKLARGSRGPYAKSAQRRQSIVEAAHRVFATRGFRGGSLQEVADEVGMSQTSLLYYFPSKSELLTAVLERRDVLTDDYSLSVSQEESLPRRVVRQASFNEGIAGVIQLYAVLCGESITNEHPAHNFFVTRFERLRSSFAQELADLAAVGRLCDGVDPHRAAASLIALWDGIQVQWLMDPESVDMAACLRDYLQLIIRPE